MCGKFAVHLRFEQNLQITHHHANSGRSRPCGRCVICQPFSCQRTRASFPTKRPFGTTGFEPASEGRQDGGDTAEKQKTRRRAPGTSATSRNFGTADLLEALCLLTRYPCSPSRIPESTPHPPWRMFGQCRSIGTFPQNVKPLPRPFPKILCKSGADVEIALCASRAESRDLFHPACPVRFADSGGVHRTPETGERSRGKRVRRGGRVEWAKSGLAVENPACPDPDASGRRAADRKANSLFRWLQDESRFPRREVSADDTQIIAGGFEGLLGVVVRDKAGVVERRGFYGPSRASFQRLPGSGPLAPSQLCAA